MTARKANPKPRVGITINAAKAQITKAATQTMGQPIKPALVSAKAAIINATQATLLDALRDAFIAANGDKTAGLTNLQLQAASGIGKSGMVRAMDDLRERELVVVAVKPHGNHQPLVLAISIRGRLALAAYKRKQAGDTSDLVQPARRSWKELDVYQPTQSSYYRNTGHGHITSRGVRC